MTPTGKAARKLLEEYDARKERPWEGEMSLEDMAAHMLVGPPEAIAERLRSPICSRMRSICASRCSPL